MKLATFEVNGRVSYGIVKETGAVDVGSRLGGQFPDLRSVIAAGQINRLEDLAGQAADFPLAEIRWLKPVPNPGKILCVGVNYPERAGEYKDNAEAPKYPSIFVRFPASLVAHEAPILRPPESKQLDYEGEVALVMGRRARRVSEGEAISCRCGIYDLQRRHNSRLAAAWQIQRYAGKKLRGFRFAGSLDGDGG